MLVQADAAELLAATHPQQAADALAEATELATTMGATVILERLAAVDAARGRRRRLADRQRRSAGRQPSRRRSPGLLESKTIRVGRDGSVANSCTGQPDG